MTRKQRVATAIGAAIGLAFGFVFFSDDTSQLSTFSLAVVFAIPAALIGFYSVRERGERQ